MKSRLFFALTALVGVAAVTVPSVASGADRVSVDVRVVTFKGQILAEKEIRTGTTTVRTSSKATCLGGKPPNGQERIVGPTALGALADLSRQVDALNPLLLSGAYDFGIGLCGVGGAVATGKQWWALKVNGKLASTGGDSTKLKRGDDVLWYLDRSYEAEMPEELKVSLSGAIGRAVTVKVVSLDSKGKRSPAAGARVFAGGNEVAVTDRSGRASFRFRSAGRKAVSVAARLAGFIPSNRVEVRNGS